MVNPTAAKRWPMYRLWFAGYASWTDLMNMSPDEIDFVGGSVH